MTKEEKRKYDKKYRMENKEKIRRRSAVYEALNKEKRKQHRVETRDKIWNYNLKLRFGINSDEYNQLFSKQNGYCAICGKHQSEFKKRLFVDHNHETGEVRGLLCHSCNIALGLFKDDLFILKKAINYLQ